MTKSMKNENPSFIEGRRSFLKGTAYSVAGATLAAGVFETVEIHEDNTIAFSVGDNRCAAYEWSGLSTRCSCPGIATLTLTGDDEYCIGTATNTAVLNIALEGVGPWTFGDS